MNKTLLKKERTNRVIIPESEIDHSCAENGISKQGGGTSLHDIIKVKSKITTLENICGNDGHLGHYVQRVLPLQGQKYDTMKFYCEHSSNVVQHNSSNSIQVNYRIKYGISAFLTWSSLNN